MSDVPPDDLFADAGEADDLGAHDGYNQDGPDLFGTEPDELILPSEPNPVPSPETDVDFDTFDEIPIDPEAEPDDNETGAGGVHLPQSALRVTAPVQNRPDAPLALYRRYRPDNFADVIGQDHVTEPLQRALINNRVNHAYLFSGPRGCGKTTSARILARCLNCEQGPTPTPCGHCQSCKDLARGGSGSIDVIEIDAASHGGVNEARDLRERAFFAPVHSRYKIYIIDEAHMVTKEGFNALLKLVEEPPPHVKFIFATTEPEKVLGTIRSRTHHYPFRLVPPKTLAGYLDRLCSEEGVAVDKAVLPLVVRAGAGSVRDSLSVLDQLLGGASEGGVSYAQATALLGYTPDTLLDEIMDAFAAGDAEGVFACVDKIIEVGQDPRRFAEDLLRRLRDLIIVAAVPDALTSGLVDVAGDQAERLTVQAQGLGAGELTRAAEVVAKGLTDMRGTTAPRLHLELMCARVLLPGADMDARGIHARLDRLERRLAMAPVEISDAPRPAPAARQSEQVEQHRAAPERAAVERQPERRRPETSRPAPAVAPADDWPTPVQAAPIAEPVADPPVPRPAAGASAGIDTAGLRRMWPQILDAVKRRRRVTWIILSQNAQVHDYDGSTLTIALNNAGAHESFGRGGSPDILRESLIEVVGIAPTIEAIVGGDPQPPASGRPTSPPASAPASAQPIPPSTQQVPPSTQQVPPSAQPSAQPTRPTAEPTSEPARRPRSQPSPEPPPDDDEFDRPNFAALARENIRKAQTPGSASEVEASQGRDDADLDSSDVDIESLLTSQLGAELLYEDPQNP